MKLVWAIAALVTGIALLIRIGVRVRQARRRRLQDSAPLTLQWRSEHQYTRDGDRGK